MDTERHMQPTIRIICDRCGKKISEEQAQLSSDGMTYEIRVTLCRECLDDAYYQGARFGMRASTNAVFRGLTCIRSQLDQLLDEEIRDKAHDLQEWKSDFF